MWFAILGYINKVTFDFITRIIFRQAKAPFSHRTHYAAIFSGWLRVQHRVSREKSMEGPLKCGIFENVIFNVSVMSPADLQMDERRCQKRNIPFDKCHHFIFPLLEQTTHFSNGHVAPSDTAVPTVGLLRSSRSAWCDFVQPAGILIHDIMHKRFTYLSLAHFLCAVGWW